MLSGKDLIKGMGYIDDDLVEEADLVEKFDRETKLNKCRVKTDIGRSVIGQLAVIGEKVFNKKNLIISGSVLTTVFIVICCGVFINKKDDVCTFTNKNDVENNIVDIEFPEYGGGTDADVIIQDSIKNKTFNNDNLCFYKMSEKDDTLIKRIVKYHKLDDEQILNQDDNYIDGSYIKVYDNGALMLELNTNVNGSITKSDEECRDIANKYLKEIGIDMNEYTYTKSSYDTMEIVGEGTQSGVNRKTIYYSRIIDDKEVLGDIAMYVSIVGDGKIDKFYCANTNIAEKYVLSDDNIIEYTKCLDDVEQKKGYVNAPEDADEIHIDNVELEYWGVFDPYADECAIVPIYKFSGEAKLNGNTIGEAFIYEKIVIKG